MMFILDGCSNIHKIRQIEENLSITVLEAEEIIKRFLCTTEDISLRVNGQELQKDAVLPRSLIRIELKSMKIASINTSDWNESSKKIKTKDNQDKFCFFKSYSAKFLNSIIACASQFCVLYHDNKETSFKSLFFKTSIKKLIHETLPILLEPEASQGNDKEFSFIFDKILHNLDEYIESKIKYSKHYFKKVYSSMKIIQYLIKFERTKETELWIKSCTNLLQLLLDNKGTSKLIFELEKSITQTINNYDINLNSIQLLDGDKKLFIMGLLDSNSIKKFFYDRGFFGYIDRALDLLKETYSSDITFPVSSNLIDEKIIIFSIRETATSCNMTNNLVCNIAYFLLFLQELFGSLSNELPEMNDYPESNLFYGIYDKIDEKISKSIHNHLQSQDPEFDSSFLSNYKFEKKFINIKPRKFEYIRNVIIGNKVKDLLFYRRKRNNRLEKKFNKKLNPKDLLALSINIDQNFSEEFKAVIFFTNLEMILFKVLIYINKLNGLCLEKLKIYITCIAQSFYSQIKRMMMGKISCIEQSFTNQFHFELPLMNTIEKLLLRLSDINFCLEGEKEANDIFNFKKVWKGFTLKGILEIYWSFKNPSFDYALLMYRFELLAELVSLRSITNLQKNAIKYLFVSDSEIYQVQNNLKTLQDLRLVCEFRRIMLNPAIKNAYSDLKNFMEYEEILEEALKNTFIFLTPKSFYGRTLISKQIVLGNFNNMKYDNEMLNGGLLYVFIHEFANYIQRYSTKTFTELLEFNTPPNYNLAQREAGFEIEKKLFGNPSKLYLTGKKFLFNIPDSVNQENILEEFKKANTPDKEFLLVRNMDSGEIETLDLDGYCGIHQRRITFKNYIDRN